MAYACLDGLQPREFFRWFGAVSEIPRGSGKEQQLVAFLQAFARERELSCETDEVGNVLMRLDATPGYEDQPSILFQAHMDMVWRKDADCAFDFETQSIPLTVEGDLLCADGTTLGADNAVGLATMLALADARDIPHPPLELLFTAEEETGMKGIRAFDMTRLRSRRMVNMDCGDSHVMAVSSAGRISGTIRKQFTQEAVPGGFAFLTVRLSGGLGGHGSLSANKGRACGGNTLGELLMGLREYPWRLCAMEGSRPIITQASATIALPEALADGAVQALEDRFAQIRAVYAETDPALSMAVTPATAVSSAPDEKASAQMAAVLSLLRSGQYRCDGSDPTIIVTLGILSAFSLKDGALRIEYTVRSTCDADQALLFARCRFLAEIFGMELAADDSYSGWPERRCSPFRDKVQNIHTRLFGRPMELERVPGGIETSIITGVLRDMDAIGIAPTARGAHTTGEHLFISQVSPYWELVKAFLAQRD